MEGGQIPPPPLKPHNKVDRETLYTDQVPLPQLQGGGGAGSISDFSNENIDSWIHCYLDTLVPADNICTADALNAPEISI
jgi:hypothetical protein